MIPALLTLNSSATLRLRRKSSTEVRPKRIFASLAKIFILVLEIFSNVKLDTVLISNDFESFSINIISSSS